MPWRYTSSPWPLIKHLGRTLMCRIAAYLGPPLALDRFLREPPHSLYRQSWEPQEMLTAVVNADGWGAAWFAPDGRPAVYRTALPVWADVNLDALGRSLRAGVWLGNVRSATAGHGTDTLNTQPFADERLAFTHNGFITDFARSLRRRLRASLDEDIEAGIQGNTDSEHLFALVRQHRGDPGEALATAVERISQWLADTDITAMFTSVVSDGAALHAVRAAVRAAPPSLYYHEHYPLFGGAVIASEAFDDDPGWRAVPPQHRVSLTADDAARVTPL